MPDRQVFLAAKLRLIRGLRKIIADAELLQADIASWNQSHAEAVPFDAGGDRCTAVIARKVLLLVESEERIPDELWSRLQKQLEDNAHA